MQDNTPRYIVSFSNGKVAKLTEQEYNDSKDQIYQFDRNASAARINDFSFDDDVDDSATYTVGLPNGKFSVFSAQQYRDSREELRKVEGIQIGSLSPVDYWGDKLNVLNKQIAELEPKHERAVAELSNPANSWDITDEDLDAGQAIEAARRSAEARDYERDIKKRLTALKEEREANPAYQSARQQRIQGLQDFTSGIESQQRALNEANPESHRIFMAPERNGMGVSDKAFDMRDNPGYYRDMEALGAAKMWIADAEKAEKAPSRYDTTRSGFQNFLTGVTSNVKELSTILGLAEGIVKNAPLISTIKQIQGQEGDNANIIALVEKMQSDPNALPYLSDAQKTLVRAFVVKTLTDAELSGDTSLGYQAGQSAIASLGFMKDFILTGGEGSIAEAAAKGATKWMTKGIAKASLDLSLKGAGRAAAQALPKFAVGTVKGAVKTAIMTPFMPSSYKNLLDNLTQMNLQDGTVGLSGRDIMQAVGDVFIDNFSENAGGQVEAILGVPFKALGTAADKVFANTAFSTWGKAVGNAQITKLLKQAGWNGFIGEIGEEWYGNALRVMTGVDKDALKDFATVDQQIITLASFAPMSIFGLGASSGQYLAAKKQMEGAGEKLSAILAKNYYSDDQIKAILAATKAENPTELAQLLSPIVNQIAADNGDASEAYKAVCDFAKAIAQYRTLDGLRDSDAEGERRQAAAAIDAELGAATPTFNKEGEISGDSPWMQQKTVDTPSGPVSVNSVRVLTDENGTEFFVKSESETDGYGLVERGTGRPVAAPTLDGYTDSGVMSLNDFLDREIARKRRGTDQVRMAQETMQNRAQIIQQAQLGTQLNLGTEENPVMGTIREIQPGDVFIIESERGTRPYSLQEVADFMRHPLNSLPVEEIDNQTAEMMNRISEKKNTLNQMLIDGTASPVKYQEQTVIRVIGQDGKGNARILTAEGEDGIDITEDELDALLAQAQQKPVADIQQEEQESQQPEDVEDTVLRDFRGNPLPLKTNKKGETVVNWVKLWKDDPEAWARWNDAQERPIVDTKLKLSEGIKDLQKEQEKLQKELSKEILHGMDEDKMDDYQDRLATVANRLDVLTKVLNTYNLPAQAADTFAGEQRRAAAEQTIREQQAGFPGIQEKWNDAQKIVGAADEIRLPNGENITGHYVLTEAYAPTPSHNPADGFKMTDGFPVDENGKTVNDRDYEHDADAQKQVLEKAANYDQRALQTPVIVSADGVVLSGNDRTMASQLAAQSGTDGAYVEYLAKYSQKYGFTAEQVQGLAHPRVVFVPDSEMEYNAATFAKFNAEDKKSQSKTEKAVKAGKTLSPEALGSLATLVDRYEDINALYNDAAGVQELLDTLQAAEVVTPEQIAALKDGDKLSGTGMDLLESTLIGSAMDEEAVRIAMSDPSIRKPIVSAIAQIIANNTIEGYTLRTELTDAIILVAQGKGAGEIKTGESVQSFIRQQHLFMDDVVASATVQMLADAINDRRTTQLKKVLSLYNRDAVDAASGQMSLLTQDVPSRDYILRNILEYLGYDTSIIFDTSERESEQRAAAEAAAADQGGNESQESEAGAPVQSDTGSAVTQFDREEVAAILEQGNVGETGLAEYMSDDEVAEFMRLWDEFLPYNDALGEAYNRLGDDLRATADKAKRKAAQAEIDRLEQAQAEAFVPVQDYVDSLLAKYDLFEEPYERNQDEAEPQDVENEIEEEEPETEVEEDIDTPEEPKPDKSKKGGKKSKKGKNAGNSGTVFSGDISDETLAAVEYTTDEVEQLIFGASLFGDYTSKKTGEKIEIVYADDEHPVYFDHQIRFWIWQKGAEYGDRHEATATTDYMMRYLKANGFKLTKPSAKKNKYGYWVNSCGVIVNPIRVELPSVHKGWAQMQHAGFAQREDGKWVITESFHDNNGGHGSPASNERGKGYDTKSDAIRAIIEHGESFLKRFAGAKSKSYEQRDIENLVRTLKTKTLPQALLEEGVVGSVHRAEITASEYDNGEQGLLFGEEELQAEIAEESAKVDTNPTEAQKEAGNYKKGHIKVDGLDISIENPKGSIRRGTDAQGREWQTEMKNSYGYIRRTESVDGDHIDIFLSDTPKRGKVFVVDQVNPETGEFDEHKVMYGFATEEEARAAYLANYEDGWKGLGAITPVTKSEFKKWIDSSNRKTKPFAEYKSVKVAEAEEDTQEDVIPSPVLEESEGTLGNYHWNDNGVCTNPTIITVPGNDRLGDVCKVSLAENNGTWYAESFVVADGGKGSSWGNRIPSIRNTSVSFGSRFAAIKSAVGGIRWLLDNPAKKQAAAFGETYNGAKELIDFLVTTELEKAKLEDTRIVTIVDGLKAYDNAKGNAKFGKVFSQLMKSVGEMIDFADDALNDALKDAAAQFKVEQVRFEDLNRAKAYYTKRVRNALKKVTGNTSMSGYGENSALVEAKETPKQEQKPAMPEYGSQNKVITTERYQELLKQWKDKMNNLNSGFDPETMMLGLQLGAYHIEAGARQFLVFSTRLIRDIGESIRPYLKSIYNGVRDFPGMEAYKADMDSASFVDEIDVNTITDTEHVNEPAVGQEETPVPDEGAELPEAEEPAWAKHNGAIQGFEGLDPFAVYNACDEYIDRIIGETRLNIAQVDMIAIGSRAFGMAREDSDLDILLEYEGDVKEDEVFNALNAEPLELMGIKVDFFPIRSQESGTLVTWLESHDNGRPVAKEQEEEPTNERLNEGDLVVLKNKPQGFDGILKVVGVNSNGTYNLEYNPTGFMPLTRMGEPADNVVPVVRNHREDISQPEVSEPMQEETPIEKYARENYTSINETLSDSDKQKAISIFHNLFSKNGSTSERDGVIEYVGGDYGISDDYRRFMHAHNDNLVFIDNGSIYQLDMDVVPAGGKARITAHRIYIRGSQSEETNAVQPSDNVGQTVGELGKYTHTKTGKEMSIVRLKGVRLSDLEFKKLKARARQFGGYWSSFKGASGFLFDNEADAIKFNTIESTDNGEITNKQTASTTAVIVSEAASAASKAEALAESTEPADEKRVNKAIARIDNALDAIDDQLALLGYYEADTSDESSFNEMYGYMKSAEKKAVKDADRLAKRLAKDLGIEVGRKTLAKANIAPAGGDITFSLQLPLPKQGTSDYQELFVDIHMEPDEGDSDNLLIGDGWGKNLAIMFRIEDTGQMGVARFGQNHFAPYNVSYDELLKAIRYQAKDFLREQPTEYTGGPVDLVQVAQEQAEKNRKAGNSKKKSVSSQEDGDAALGGLFADLYEAEEDVDEEPEMPVGLGRKREKPTEVNGFKVGDKVIYTPNQGKRQPVQATIHDFEYDGRPVLDTGLAPVLYEVTEWENVKPLNTENDGLQGNDESSAQGTPAESVQPGGGAQETTGGNGPAEGQDGGRADSGRAGGSESPVRNPRHRYDDSVKRNTRNNRVAKGEVVYPKTPAARYKANIAAIRLLKELQDSGKQATKEQMAVLRQYTGWGGLGTYFNNTYSSEYRELKSLLSDEEMQAAAMSGNTAFYTPVEVIDTMWDIAKRLGFEGGNVLEGSAGIGSILASMPKGISEHSAITAVELDSTTGGILELLYPDANVLIRGFEEADIPNGSVDLAITNVPFGNNIQVYDEKEKDLTRKFGGRIHDFCIAKNIRKLAEGGLGIFISTRGTLDNPSKSLRSWIVNEGGADIIGAFRMNNTTFEGTGATSDIIVVRKRVGGKVSPNAIDVSSTQITRRETYDTGKTEWNRNTRDWEHIMAEGVMEINSYFVEHPENMGGKMGFGFEHKDTYRPGSAALWPDEKIDQQKRLAKWAKQFSDMQEETAAPVAASQEQVVEESTATKEGQLITNSKGEICVSRSGKAVPLGVNAQKVKGYTKAQALGDYNALKAAINEVLDYQLKNESDEGLKPLLAKLNRAYDTFSRRYGSLNRNTAISFLRNDVDFPAIAAVEDYKEKKGIDGKVKVEVKKTGIFNGRVLGAKRVPTPQTAKDGVIVSINQYGRIDIPFIAQSLGKDEDAVRDEILSSGLGFENPLTSGIEVEYEYLSGNVREKLEYAREHNEGGKYDANIKALEKVIPAEIPAHLIEFSLGSDWLPTSLYTEYAKERFGLNDNFVPKNFGGSWSINENVSIDARNEKNRSAGVSSDMLGMTKLGHELMLAAMNKATVAFSKTYKDDDGHSHTEHDKEASQAAATKIDEMRDDFKEWCRARILGDKDLSDNITKTYNDTFNAIVPKEIRDTFLPEHFEGQVLTMGKEGKLFHLYPHQAKAVIRATTEPLMMAHEVGTGKTFTLISTAMEMRRLGTAKKPMIVVQNATLGQFVSSAKELYPNAKVLTITESDRTVEGRSAFYAKIKYNDWDIIIVPQSVFEMIPDSEERKRAFIQEKIDEKKFILEQAKEAKNQAAQRRLQEELKDLEYERDHDGEKRPKKGRNTGDAKKTAEALANASAKAKKQLDRKVDDVADFDDMGIDALLIDEAHAYKHLGFSTSMQRGVKGVDPSYSKKSAGVYLKTRAVFDKVGWKNVVFATGTPISNTAAEIWTFMKYLMPDDVMRRLHIYYFDDFVSNFGNISQSLEFTTSGKFKENARFASYTNLPELIRIWSSVTDTVLTKEAVAAKAEDGAVEKLDDKVPQMETWTDNKGESHENQVRDIYLPQSPALVDIMTAIRARLEWYEGLTGKEKKENSHVPLVMFGLAKMAAIDPRLVDRSAKDEPLSKTNRVVEETLKALEDSKRYKGTAALFCDNFRRWDTDDSGKRVEGFNIFEEIKRKLVAAGVPEDQIVIMKSGMTTAAKEKIFARVNAGDVRVIMGTTATLGTGVNIQERLFFEGHIDAPNRPMDYTQRMGRILRQGNLHKEWGIPVRVVRFGVEDSLDVTAYQRLSTKSKFINSIMDGKPLLANGMENRVLEEEEEGEFDNPVAVLSGSQYALLKSQAERELRKLRNKKEQHRQDQIYIERALKDNELEIARRKEYIAEDKEHLKKLRERYPDGKVTDITIEGVKVKGAEQINAALKAKVIDPIKSAVEIAKRNPAAGRYSGLPQTKVFKFILGGTEVFVRAKISAWRDYDEKTNKTSILSSTEIEYYCPEFGYAGEGFNDYIRMAGGLNAVKDIIGSFEQQFAHPFLTEASINRNTEAIARLESDNELMLRRRGKPFADEDKLAKQEALVKDYTEKMHKELAEKEAKYAEMAKNAKTSFNLDTVEIEDEDEEEDTVHNREGEDSGRRINIDDATELARAITAIRRLARRIGVKVNIVRGDRNGEKGSYTEGSDSVTINIASAESIADALDTLLHEAVGHYGLRELFGGEKALQNFINEMLDNAPAEIRDKIQALADEYGWDMNYAAEEYLAELAVSANRSRAEHSLWRRIIYAINNLISTIVGADVWVKDSSIEDMFSERGLERLMRKSFDNLESRSDLAQDDKLHAGGFDLAPYQERLDRINDAIKEQGETPELLKEKTSLFLEFLEQVKTSDLDTHVCQMSDFKSWLLDRGLDEKTASAQVAEFEQDSFFVGGYFPVIDTAVFLTERIPSIDFLRQAFVHERQHVHTNENWERIRMPLLNAFGYDRSHREAQIRLYQAVFDLCKSSSYGDHIGVLASEFISYAMQLLYTDENFENVLKKYYISDAAIEIIKQLYDERRRSYVHSDEQKRNAQGRVSDTGASQDLGATPEGESGQVQRRSDAGEDAIGYQGGGEGAVTHFRVRTKPAPKKTGIGYKVFFRGKDGALYPPMVANPNGEATPVGVWLDADAAPVAGQSKTGRPQVKAGGKGTQGGSGTLAYRPGWHLGEIPYAIQFNRINPETGQRELFPRDFVWAEVEYAADKDYQKDADAEGMTEGGKYRHSYAGLKEVPEDGFYRYRTNPNPETDPWIITGAMKVNRILTDEEVDELVRAAGREPQKREPSVSRNRVAYHGSIADFDAFDIDHAGEGEGYQSHGYGHYVALNKDTAIGYAWSNAFDKADKEGLISPTIAEIIRNDSFDDYDSMVERYDELHAKRIEELKQEIADERKERTPDMNTIGLLETELGLLEKDRPLREVFEGMRNLYTVEIPEDTGTNYLDEKGETPKSVVSRIYAALNQLAKDKKNKELAERVQIKKPTIEQIYGDNGQIRTGGALYDGLSLILGSPLEASRFLHGIGIVGIKYDGRSDGQCAVIFSNEDLRIEEHERWRQGGDYGNPSPVRYKESIGARRLSASETATKFGVGIEFRPSSEMRQDGKPLAGRWVDGKIYICLEHCRDNDDAVRTVLHEGVGHQGLRRLIGGDNMREFCLDIFRNAPVAVRSKIAKDAVEKYGGNVVEAVERMAADDVIREVGGEAVFESAEEWMAETSETIDYDNYRRNLWDIIRSALRKALAKVGINIPLSVRDVKWLMVQSAFANHETDALVEARRQVVAKELGFTLRQQANKAEGIRLERNRRADESLSSAARLYNKDVLYWWSRLHETWVDKDDAVHRIVSAIEKASGKVAETFEDIRLSLNQQSSKGLAAIEKFEREYYEPMKAAIKYIMGEKGCSLEDVERYVMLKHGLERNEVFAKRDARAYYQDLHDGNVRTIQNSDKIDDITKLQLIAREDKKLQKNLDAIEAGTDSKYLEFRKQDYGGLTAMYSEYDDFAPFDESLESNEEYQARVLQARHPKYTYIDENGREQVDMAATEDAARKEVEAFENGSEDSTKNLWERINAATKATLKHQYDSNMMSREQYLSVSKMFKYYVPLRGFADNTAEDMYDYYHSDQRNTFTPPLLVAKGRKTEAESPFGYIGAMASSGIAADMKNETKLALYYFVSNRSDNDLVSISEVWYKVTGVDELGRKIFTPVYPPFKEDLSSEEAKQAFRDWEEQMKEEAKAGLAYKGMRKLDLHKSVIHIDENQKTSHIIRFKVGGKDMMMYINGNPRAAQAINNELNVEMSTDYQKFFGKILRYFSGINTSYNPEFWLSNAQRDALFAMMSVSTKEDPAYNEAFRKNFGKILAQTLVPGMKGGAYSLKRKLDNGTLGETPIENLYREFVENGGVTGYTTLKNNEEWELELRKYTGKDKRAVKAVKTAFGVVQDFGEAIEQMTRFAAYMTSREQGKDIKDSVNDAKELTVNFNRKGSGKTISWQEAGRLRTKDGKKLTPVQKALVVGASWLPAYGRRFIMFFNASTQGLNAMYKLFKKNPGKMGIWTAAYFALGVVQAVIHALLDDDDDYLDIPDYERRNNLLLGGKGVYFKWALPQEARVFYAMGDMVVNHAMGREPHKSILSEVLAAASDIAPLNPSGGLSALAPSALTPVVEVIQNRDYKGAKIYNDMRYLSEEERKRTPAYQKAYQSTGRPYILISQFFNWVSGGDYADAGWININPASVEHILKGATGGAGTTIGKLYRGTFGQLLGEDFSVRNTPFLSRILTVNDDRYRNAHTTELFDYYKAEAEHTKKLINTYRKNGDDDKLDRLYDSEDYEIMLIYNTYKGELQYYNDELKITEDKKERKALMREQDAIRKQMILEISNIGKND